MIVLALSFGFVTSGLRLEAGTVPEPTWLFSVDQVVGVAGCAALWLRRRRPVGLAVALVAASALAETVAGAMLAALFSLAIHRPPRTTLTVFALSLVAAGVYVVQRPEPDLSPVAAFVFGVTVQACAVGWGLVVRHRRQLVESLRDRAARAEHEARLREEQAHRDARDAIAREIHDVLGHRLSLLSVHAGALQYRPDAPADDVVRAAGIIRENAHQALQDLREVIGVLRAPADGLPQPTLTDLPALVAESEQAGVRVALHDDVVGRPPDRLARAGYRTVQEGLTNARRHASGAAVEVRLRGRPGSELTVEVVNGPPPGQRQGPVGPDHPAPDDHGQERPGQGLLGLRERASLLGGAVEHGPDPAGGWRLTARLPWPP